MWVREKRRYGESEGEMHVSESVWVWVCMDMYELSLFMVSHLS